METKRIDVNGGDTAITTITTKNHNNRSIKETKTKHKTKDNEMQIQNERKSTQWIFVAMYHHESRPLLQQQQQQ